jgi:hypothetical protein
MQELLRNRQWVLERDPSASALRLARTDAPYATLDELERAITAVLGALDAAGRAKHTLLIDLRQGPLRTDPEFESAMQHFRVETALGFVRVALLVRTAVGKLQVQRHVREEHAAAQVFTDEAEALEYLRTR